MQYDEIRKALHGQGEYRVSYCICTYYYYYYNDIRLTTFFQDTLGKPAPERNSAVGRRAYDCTVPVGLRQPLCGPFVVEKCSLHSVSPKPRVGSSA